MDEKIKIVLTGGGTAGPVMPLIAIVQAMREKNISAEFLFLGTAEGPEEEIARKENLKFMAIPAGKLRRYFSLKNFFSPFKVISGMWAARKILREFKPNIVISAGGFVAVPVIRAAHSLKIPSFIHQQDITKGLANKLCEKKADKITVSFEKQLLDFPRGKTVLTGNPVRPDILKGDRVTAQKIFLLKNNLPTLLITGGGTGALKINKIIGQILPELIKFCQIIHLTGEGKKISDFAHENYHPLEFLDEEMKHALAVADLVVSRAGFSALSELSALGKPSIIIPIFRSHQEQNALFFEKKKAVIVLRENILVPDLLLATIKELLGNESKLAELKNNISRLSKKDAPDKMIRLILEIKK